jgi:HPt (histidine-containing phosphotransfer) domain-containing protein
MTHSISDLPGFDISDALDRFGGSKAKFYKYLCLMIADFDKRFPAVKLAVNAADGLSASAQLHSLAGTASALSATELASLCHYCELNCKQQNWPAAAQHVSKIEGLLTSISLHLRQLGYNQNGGGPVW